MAAATGAASTTETTAEVDAAKQRTGEEAEAKTDGDEKSSAAADDGQKEETFTPLRYDEVPDALKPQFKKLMGDYHRKRQSDRAEITELEAKAAVIEQLDTLSPAQRAQVLHAMALAEAERAGVPLGNQAGPAVKSEEDEAIAERLADDPVLKLLYQQQQQILQNQSKLSQTLESLSSRDQDSQFQQEMNRLQEDYPEADPEEVTLEAKRLKTPNLRLAYLSLADKAAKGNGKTRSTPDEDTTVQRVVSALAGGSGGRSAPNGRVIKSWEDAEALAMSQNAGK